MSKKTRKHKRKIKATHEVVYLEVKRKSRAGIEYTKNVPVTVPKK